MKLNYFQGKKIWITGASSGIGKALAIRLSQAGALLILSSRNAEKLNQVKEQCEHKVKVIVEPLDTSVNEQIDLACDRILAEHQIDILILNAGISQRSNALETEFAIEERIMNTNFRGAVRMAKHVLRQMVARESGHLVVMSSVTGKIGVPSRSTYSASKHALHGYFDSLRAEVEEKGIYVTLICPGYIYTNISQNALLGDGTAHSKKDENSVKGMKVENFVEKALNAVVKKKKEVYIGGKEILGIYLKRFYPSLLRKIITKQKI